jgi:hypothetical protein
VVERGVFGLLAALLATSACVTRKPCRPGTILLTLDMGEAPQVELEVHGGGWDSPRGTIRRVGVASAVVVEIRLPTYRTTDQIDVVVTPPGADPITQEVILGPGCTSAFLQVTPADGGPPGGADGGAPRVTDGAELPPPDGPATSPADAASPGADAGPTRDAQGDSEARDATPARTDAPASSDARDAGSCTAMGSCTPAPCHTGVYSCATGVPVCTDTGTVNNGIDCGAGKVCKDGSCVTCNAGGSCTPADCKTGNISCASGSPVCMPNGGTLVDGIACGGAGAHRACKSGLCACAPGYDSCSGTCLDITSDPANCGGCGHACGAKMACAGSLCSCMAGLTGCPDGCVDLRFDDNNCSACGIKCPPTTSCGAGACL